MSAPENPGYSEPGTANIFNHLKSEASPYLKMHAHNPIDWYPWGDEALEKAVQENKLLVISIGYSACHWCHVMEKESFRDEEVAGVMNRFFVSIKVDREERPDLDQIYLNAAQIVQGRGGWPLNIIALPDGRPVYAGTYFPRQTWISLLRQINQLYFENADSIIRHAEAITRGIQSAGIIRVNNPKPDFNEKDLECYFEKLVPQMDYENGGLRGAPKFPLPVILDFLLRFHHITGDKRALRAVEKTLESMIRGGIFDQIGGGFYRYATDRFWKIPHFEKMLYDNAQLVSLFSSAYQLTRKSLYKDAICQTLEFIGREMTAPESSREEGGLYSSLDADSEGEEGKFYTWTSGEIKEALGKDAPLISEYYGIISGGNWERGRNIPFRKKSDPLFARQHNLKTDELKKIIARNRERLGQARLQKIRPALDDKIITAWNALMVTGYVDAYRVLDEDAYIKAALKTARFLTTRMMTEKGRLKRIYREESSETDAFLDDYAFTIRAFLSLYGATFDRSWLNRAGLLLNHVLRYFYESKNGLFYYTSSQNPRLISRQMEVTDGVMPASNSTMALNLFQLGHYFQDESYIRKSGEMLTQFRKALQQGSAAHANWANLLAYLVEKPVKITLAGRNRMGLRKKLDQHFIPQIILLGGDEEGNPPTPENKSNSGRNRIYICKDQTCFPPVSNIDEALKIIGGNDSKKPKPRTRKT